MGLTLLMVVGGIFFWRHYQINPSTPPATTINPKPTPQYPLVTQWQIPILMYHYIRIAPADNTLGQNLSVNPTNFDDQMKTIVNDGYITIKMSDIADPEKKAISKIYAQKKKPIALTFDDGYEDAYSNALPILQKYQMTATFYIIRDYTNRPEYMNQDQINNLTQAGFEIGSHSLSHPNLATASETTQHSQIFDSKAEATSFCYPSGKFNDTTVNLVKNAGYTTAVTTKIGIAKETSDLLKLPRVRAEDGSAQALLDKINYAFEYGE